MKGVVLIEKLTDAVPNKYEAVRVIAREARRINSLLMRGGTTDVEEKPTMMALRRLLEGKVKYIYGEKKDDQELFDDSAE
jgi:DNA-directed RNA polymerase omega subunit